MKFATSKVLGYLKFLIVQIPARLSIQGHRRADQTEFSVSKATQRIAPEGV